MFSRISDIQIVEFRLMPATGYRLRVVVKDCEKKKSICWCGIQGRCLPLKVDTLPQFFGGISFFFNLLISTLRTYFATV